MSQLSASSSICHGFNTQLTLGTPIQLPRETRSVSLLDDVSYTLLPDRSLNNPDAALLAPGTSEMAKVAATEVLSTSQTLSRLPPGSQDSGASSPKTPTKSPTSQTLTKEQQELMHRNKQIALGRRKQSALLKVRKLVKVFDLDVERKPKTKIINLLGHSVVNI